MVQLAAMFAANDAKRKQKEEEQKKAEAVEILKHLEISDFLVCLDEHGKQFTSVEFANCADKIKLFYYK